jgi:hypothetical protein
MNILTTTNKREIAAEGLMPVMAQQIHYKGKPKNTADPRGFCNKTLWHGHPVRQSGAVLIVCYC